MRLKVSRSKNSASFYVTKTVYIDKKEKTVTVEKLGTEKDLREKLNGQDPYEWAKSYLAELNRLEKEGKEPKVIAEYQPSKQIKKYVQKTFNGGYLFLQKIYNDLKLDKICNQISKKRKFEFDLNSILSRLVYSRILYPASKKSTFELSKNFIEQPNFDLHQIYRALDVISDEQDFIQQQLYKNSLNVVNRNTKILYYDCTNFFIETTESEGLKQYGISKEHRPNPIVQMGLFMDGNGIPLAFNISKGNTNEQTTLKPLEEQILRDFNISKLIVCTDAGLSSTDNRKFNNVQDRAFITTQSVKKLKKHLTEWALDCSCWKLNSDKNSKKTYDISQIDEIKYEDKIFYKECWIVENGIEQRLIVTYSIRYRNYHRFIRNSQIDRALKLINDNPSKLNKSNANDYKRLIDKTSITSDGEVAKKNILTLNTELINKEEMYDGFYPICTNLEGNVNDIVKINHNRWEIEESFRIMKSEFKSRPVYLQNDNRICAHFLTCFISLLVYRILEKKLDNVFTASTIISKLKTMNFLDFEGQGLIPAYTRDDFTDKLHENLGFRTDYEIITKKTLKNIFNITQNK